MERGTKLASAWQVNWDLAPPPRKSPTSGLAHARGSDGPGDAAPARLVLAVEQGSGPETGQGCGQASLGQALGRLARRKGRDHEGGCCAGPALEGLVRRLTVLLARLEWFE